jgi:putative transposase
MYASPAAAHARTMPRQPRFWFPGAVLHVVQRGNNRAPVFVDDDDRHRFVDDLLVATCKHRVAVHAYVLMTNHVHLLATPLDADAMPRTMQTAGRRYVGRFNRVHSRTGTLWEGRYKAALVDTDRYFFTCMRYIELNPLRAGIVGRPEDYRWSSHRANACCAEDRLVTFHTLYSSLGGTAESRCDVYRRMFERALHEHELHAIRDATQFEWALAGEPFRQMAEALAGRRATRLPMGPRPRAPDG